MLTVESFTFNPFSENTYVISTDTKECLIIDPGCYTKEEKKMLTDFIINNGFTPIYIFLTHTHIDHIFGLASIKTDFDIPIIAHPLAEIGLKSTQMVAQLYGFSVDDPPKIDQLINEGDELTLGNYTFQLLYCPGHAQDHLILYSAQSEFAIVGDVIFKESIGRSDLPGGNQDTLMASIHQKVLQLPLSTVLYPGHGPETTINHEITNNPYLK